MSTYGSRRKALLAMFDAMLRHFGPSNWWPAQSAFEVALGAILTQNTAWRNVDKALANLFEATGLVPSAVAGLDEDALRDAVRPAGFFTQKSATLRRFFRLMEEYGGLSGDAAADASLACFSNCNTETLRETLLGVSGIGPETADCILLYGLSRPVFVVDAYTRRIFHRHAMVDDSIDYGTLQEFFMEALEGDVALFNEFHACIVRIGKDFCHKGKARCYGCPLQIFLEHEPQ